MECWPRPLMGRRVPPRTEGRPRSARDSADGALPSFRCCASRGSADAGSDPCGNHCRRRCHRGSPCRKLAFSLSRHPEGQHARPDPRRRTAGILARRARGDGAGRHGADRRRAGLHCGMGGRRCGLRRLHRQSSRPSRAAKRWPWPPAAGRGDAAGRRSRRGARLSLGVRRQHACHRILSAVGRRDRRRWRRSDRRADDPAKPHRLARHAAFGAGLRRIRRR
jgi:hypothetical protein